MYAGASTGSCSTTNGCSPHAIADCIRGDSPTPTFHSSDIITRVWDKSGIRRLNIGLSRHPNCTNIYNLALFVTTFSSSPREVLLPKCLRFWLIGRIVLHDVLSYIVWQRLYTLLMVSVQDSATHGTNSRVYQECTDIQIALGDCCFPNCAGQSVPCTQSISGNQVEPTTMYRW